MHQTLTTAVQSISIQLVPCVTAAVETPNVVIATVFTTSICSVAFINVYVITNLLRSVLYAVQLMHYCRSGIFMLK